MSDNWDRNSKNFNDGSYVVNKLIGTKKFFRTSLWGETLGRTSRINYWVNNTQNAFFFYTAVQRSLDRRRRVCQPVEHPGRSNSLAAVGRVFAQTRVSLSSTETTIYSYSIHSHARLVNQKYNHNSQLTSGKSCFSLNLDLLFLISPISLDRVVFSPS